MGLLPIIQGAYYILAGTSIISRLASNTEARAIPSNANPRRLSRHPFGLTAYDYGLHNTTQLVQADWKTNIAFALEFKRNIVPNGFRPEYELPKDYVAPGKPLEVRLHFGFRDLNQNLPAGQRDIAGPEQTFLFTPDFVELPLSVMFDQNQRSISPAIGSAPISVSLLDRLNDPNPQTHAVASGAPVYYIPLEPPTAALPAAIWHNYHISMVVAVIEPSWDAFAMWFNPADPNSVSVGWIGHDNNVYQLINYDQKK